MTDILNLSGICFDSAPFTSVFYSKYVVVRGIKHRSRNGGMGSVHKAELKKAGGVLYSVAIKRRRSTQDSRNSTMKDEAMVS